MAYNLSNDVRFTRLNELSTGPSGSTSGIVDMANWEGVLFFGNVGTTGAGGITLTIAQGASTTGFVNLSGATLSTTGPNNWITLGVYRPEKRYLRCTVSASTNNRRQVFALQYGARGFNTAANSTRQLGLVSPGT